MRKLLSSILPLLLMAGIIALLPVGAQADDDPPGRVARLNYADGSVSFQVQGDADWVQADPNRPLTTGDNIWADKDSRSEIHIDSTAIRLSAETGLSFLNLDDRTVQLQLPQGTIEVHLRQLAAGDAFEVDTPNLAFTLTRAGEYMISTDPNGGSTMINIREGEGEVTGAGDSWDLRSGQAYSFQGTDQLTYDAEPLAGFTDFESWCQTRDQRENNSPSAKYVSRDVDGYYDLDDYGDWSNDADYGNVWYPRAVAVDWQPYHVGHWVYIAPWGWTWVDEEPWGFAPFHYGRWVLVGARWGWVPGPVVVRPVYAPALVGFVGGAGFGLSVTIGGGFSGVAWFPLGPRDVFVPAYRCSPHYVQVVNVTNTRVVNVTQVTNVYNTVIVNKQVTNVNYTYSNNVHAVTAVSHDTFVNARSVTRESVHINDTQIRDVHVVSNTVPAPTRTSYVSATAKVSTSRPAVPFANRPVVANLTPRVPVQAPRPTVRTNTTQSFNSNNRPNGNSAGNPAGNAPASNNGFRSFQPPNNNGQTNGGQSNASQGRPQGSNPPSNTQPTLVRPSNNGNTANNAPSNPPANGSSNSSNNGFRPFQPSGSQSASGGNQPSNTSRSLNNNGGSSNNSNRPETNANDNQRYRFSPPVKAKDDNYDVHPPLNQGSANSSSQSGPSNQGGEPKPEERSNSGGSGSRGNNNNRPSRNNDSGNNKR